MKWLLALIALLFGFAGGLVLSPSGSEREEAKVLDAADSSEVILTGLVGRKKESGSEASIASLSGALEPISESWLERIGELDDFDQIGVLHSRLKGVAPSEFAGLMDDLGDLSGNSLSWQIRSMIASRWAQIDPQGMLAYAQGQNGPINWGLYSTIFSAWAKQDAQAAYQAAMLLDSERSQQAAMQSIINNVATENPQRAIEMAQDYYGSDLGGRGRWLFQSIYRNWASRDGEAARRSALALEDGVVKSSALAGALSEWVADDPVEALAWLDSLPMSSAVYSSRKEVFRNFLNRDFAVAKEYIDSVEDPVKRRQIMENVQFHNLAWKKSFEEIEEIFDWMGTVATGQVYDNRVSSVIRAMADKDPDRAVEFVLNMRPGNARMNGLNAIGSKLVEIDPERAFAFIDTLAYEDEKRRALGSMGWRLSQQGAESASSLITGHSDPLVQRQLASRISSEWSNYDQAAALAWSESLSDEQARQSALRSVVKNWIELDTAATLEYIDRSEDINDKVSALRDAYSDWARNDPEAAVAWLDALPESVEERKGDIYRGVASSYIQHDPMAASEWIATLDEGPERDQSVETLVNNISRTDPEAGFIWAATVDDSDKRKNTLRRSIQEWVKTDPDAAFDALKDAKIDASEKEPLFKLIEDKR